MSTFDCLFTQGMPTPLTSSTKLEDDFILFDTPDPIPIPVAIKSELYPHDDPLSAFQDWSLKVTPPPSSYLPTNNSSSSFEASPFESPLEPPTFTDSATFESSPFESPLEPPPFTDSATFEASPFESPLEPPPFSGFTTPFSGNFEDSPYSPYQSPFQSPLFNFDEEANLPPTPRQIISPDLDEGYGTGNSKAFLVDFGFSPEQLNYKNEFSFEPPIFEPSATAVSGSLFLPIEDLTAGNNLPMIHTVMVSSSPASISSDDFPPFSNGGSSPKRKRSSEEENNEGRNFPCEHPHCGRVFARLFNLHTHEKTHDPNRDKPYVCTANGCVKSFARKHDLFRHETSVHDGLRDYKCNSCSKLFSRKDALRRHLAVKGCNGV